MSRQSVYVPLSAVEFEALKTLGRLEDREPRRQAARMLRESLIRAGALADPTEEQSGRQPAEAVAS